MEDDAAEYLILMNDENEYRLWLESEAVPVGWTQVGPLRTRNDCLLWIERNVPEREVN
jgi:MbtH protein